MERVAIGSVLMIAWAWIMVFFGMIFYHGYQYHRVTTTTTAALEPRRDSAANPTAPIPKSSLDVLEQNGVAQVVRDEISKHQESRRIEHGATTTTTDAVTDKEAMVHDTNNNNLASAALPTLSSVRIKQQQQPVQLQPHESPLLIFTCQRANYLHDTLTHVLRYIPSDCSMGCPVIVSQDGTNADVAQAIAEFAVLFLERKGISLIHMQHKSAIRRGANSVNSYQALAIHYGWALTRVFDGTAVAAAAGSPAVHSSTTKQQSKDGVVLPLRVIILEEDLKIASDFFDYFHAMAPILDADETLLAVSAFNDNGFQNTVQDTSRVLRSDFFPGLGWMMNRQLWTTELQSKWPQGWWDDWLREPAQRMGRHVLRPEVSRTFHFGVSGGASENQFGNQLSRVWLNDEKVEWKTAPTLLGEDLVSSTNNHWTFYLQSKEIYDEYYWYILSEAHWEATVADAVETARVKNVRLEYDSHSAFQTIVRQLQPPLMDDEKAGIHRTSYQGVVETRPHGRHFLFITPPMDTLRLGFASAIAAFGGPSSKKELIEESA